MLPLHSEQHFNQLSRNARLNRRLGIIALILMVVLITALFSIVC